jgi:thiol-disulfide isomerase/thioredoxin
MRRLFLSCLLAWLPGCTTADPPSRSPAPGPAPVPAAPASAAPDVSGGDPGFDDDVRDVVGKPARPWDAGAWFNSPPLDLADLRGKVVVVRWFMSPSCPLCSATAPSLVLLDQRYRDRGLSVVGMYHHKDPEPLDLEKVRGYVAHFGYTFPVAVDPDWRTLRRWWSDGHPKREYTSVTFVIDRAGVVRHVHLGGKLAPGSPEFAVVEGRVKALLDEPAPARASR